MPWSRLWLTAAPSRVAAWFTIATGECNTCRFATPSAWPKRASSPPWAASATAMTMPLAESINGLYKTEVIRRRGPWRSLELVEFATLEWVEWFNNRRLLGPIGNVPPAEAEARYYADLETLPIAA